MLLFFLYIKKINLKLWLFYLVFNNWRLFFWSFQQAIAFQPTLCSLIYEYLPRNFPFTLRPQKLKIDSIRTCKYKYTYFSPLENIQRRWGVCITYSFVLHTSIQQGVRCVWSLASSQTIYKKNPTGSWIWPRPPSPVPRPPSSRTLRPSPPAPLPWLLAAVTHEHSTNCHCSSNSHNLLIFLR
jgi:hypothetical protein